MNLKNELKLRKQINCYFYDSNSIPKIIVLRDVRRFRLISIIFYRDICLEIIDIGILLKGM